MTSELLTMNKGAVALAADSAVTINGKKVRNGVEKLFKLSNDLPMGMMIFGNANFDNIPMETLIKQYSKNADFKSLENIENIQEDFLKYLGRVTPPFDFKKSIGNTIGEYADELKEKFSNISEEEFNKFIDEIEIDDSLDFVKSLPEFGLIDSLIEDILPNFVLDNEKDDLIIVLKMNFFMKMLSSSTGVVIAGFNEEDLFPSFVSFDLIVNNSGDIEIKSFKSEINYPFGVIVPFAQTDVIDTFLTGSSILLKNVLSCYFFHFINNYTDLIIESIKSTDIDESSKKECINQINGIKSFHSDTTSNFIEFFNNWEDIIMGPILSAINTLPKQELADLAY